MFFFFYLNIFEIYSFTIWSDPFSTVFFFKLFSSFALFFASLLFLVQHPIYSLLCLLLVTIFCGFILFLLNFEFLAIILLLVYIGGIGVLFLFAIILLNFKRFQVKLIWNVPVIFFIEFFCFTLVDSFLHSGLTKCFSSISFLSDSIYFSDIYIIGNLMYTEYCFSFLLIGVILLLAMIGSIFVILTLIRDVYNK